VASFLEGMMDGVKFLVPVKGRYEEILTPEAVGVFGGAAADVQWTA
jgi:hypothetical protein